MKNKLKRLINMSELGNYTNSSLKNVSAPLDTPHLFISIINTFIIPVICGFGMITNSICILVFVKLKLKYSLFKYMLVTSTYNFFYLFLCSFSFSFRCSYFCSFESTWIARVYQVYIYLYFTSVLAISNSIFELVIYIKRYMSMRNLKIGKKVPIQWIILAVTISSLVFYLPVLFVFTFEKDSLKNSSYNFVKTEFSKTIISRALIILITTIRGPVILVFIFIINILTIIEFKRLVDRKSRLQKNELNRPANNKSHEINSLSRKSEINMSKMVICMWFLFIVCNLPNTVVFITNILGYDKTSFYLYLTTCSNTVLFIYHGLSFFIYYWFNKKFRNFLLDRIRFVKCVYLKRN